MDDNPCDAAPYRSATDWPTASADYRIFDLDIGTTLTIPLSGISNDSCDYTYSSLTEYSFSYPGYYNEPDITLN